MSDPLRCGRYRLVMRALRLKMLLNRDIKAKYVSCLIIYQISASEMALKGLFLFKKRCWFRHGGRNDIQGECSKNERTHIVFENFSEIYIFYPWNVSKILLSLAPSKQGVKNYVLHSRRPLDQKLQKAHQERIKHPKISLSKNEHDATEIFRGFGV